MNRLELPPDDWQPAQGLARAREVRARLRGAVARPVVIRVAPPVPAPPRPAPKPAPAPPPAPVSASSAVPDREPAPEPRQAKAPRIATLPAIIHATARCFHLDLSELLSDCRTHSVCFARHVGIYVARRLTKAGMIEIGRAFGRDHTVVIHAVRKIGALHEAQDPGTVAAVDAITAAVFSGDEEFPVLPPAAPHTRVRWTESQIAELRRQWAEGVPSKLIAESVGKDFRRVRAMASSLKLRRPPSARARKRERPQRQPFPFDDHIGLMKRLREAGVFTTRIRLELIKASGRNISLTRVKDKIRQLEEDGVIGRRQPFKGTPWRRCDCGASLSQQTVWQCRACWLRARKSAPVLYEEVA